MMKRQFGHSRGVRQLHAEWMKAISRHDASDNVAGLERELHVWKPSREAVAEFFLKGAELNRCLRLERHLQDTFVRSARPEKDGVDRIG